MISIIVPVYNVEPYIRKCVDSILGQTFSDIEIILVNDGSTDKSGEICDEYVRKDSRVKVINKCYGGVSSARNEGTKAAIGEYIGFVDGDDFIRNDMYEKLYRICNETDSDIAVCKLGREIDGILVNSDETGRTEEMNNIEAMKQLFIGKMFRFSLCNKLFKKECFKEIEFPQGRIHEDLSTTYRIFSNSRKAVYIDYIGYIYVKRANSILTSEYCERRLQSFIGWDEIIKFMRKNYGEIFQVVIACFVYWCIDNIHYILNQVGRMSVKRRYLKTIQQYVKKYYRLIMKESKISIKFKLIVTSLSLSAVLVIALDNIRRLFSPWKTHCSKIA